MVLRVYFSFGFIRVRVDFHYSERRVFDFGYFIRGGFLIDNPVLELLLLADLLSILD